MGSEWKPIETAPRDGTEVILHDRGTVGSGFWSKSDGAYRADDGWFWEMDRGDLLIARNCSPTEWMPLPPPPGEIT